MYSWPNAVNFHRQVSSYFEKDDHDAWVNDCWPTMKTDFMHEFTFRQGLAIFREQVPMGPKTYRQFRWGKDVEFWLVEGRDFRSPNGMQDGPEKSILGKKQKAWLKKSMSESDATFRFLISPTPLIGPDRGNKNDNYSNKGFAHEGNELREFLSGLKNTVVICGDRHWQYMSVDPKTGLREYSVGSASNEHAGGWKKDDFRPDYHRYMKVIGGYLSVDVQDKDGKPTATFQYHNVDGGVEYEDVLTAE